MSKIISTKKINSIFLATVLIVGTFALMSPSFMNSAQAEPGYEKPKYPSYKPDYNYKSKDTIGIKKVNCNNVNLNVNDASVNNVGRPPVGDFTTLDTSSSEPGEQEGITTANNFANGERPNNGFMKDKDGFVFVCINNNNNAGQGGDDEEVNQCAEDVEACFQQFLRGDQFPRFVSALESQAGITVVINGESVTLRSFADICEALEGLTYEQLEDAVGAIVNTALAPSGGVVLIQRDLFDCIADALNIPIPELPR